MNYNGYMAESKQTSPIVPPVPPELYIVVCSDYHSAFGPFTDLADAVIHARSMTDAGACVYLPVPLEVDPETVRYGPMPDPEPASVRHTPGGYL